METTVLNKEANKLKPRDVVLIWVCGGHDVVKKFQWEIHPFCDLKVFIHKFLNKFPEGPFESILTPTQYVFMIRNPGIL